MIAARLRARLAEQKARLEALRPLPPASVRCLHQQLALEWTYNSNAIEGSTLTLRETQLILETGLTIGGKSLREHFEVINHRAAIEYVQVAVRISGTEYEPPQAWEVPRLMNEWSEWLQDEVRVR